MASDRIYVRGFPLEFSAGELKARFKEFGRVRRSYLKTGEDGRVCGFVRYFSSVCAEKALSLNGVREGEIDWVVAKALNKNERDRNSMAEYDRITSERNGRNLVIRNLPETFGINDLNELFSPFGTIKNSTVLKRKDNFYGFVEYETIEFANQAIEAMKGLTVRENQIDIQKHLPKHVLGPHIISVKKCRAANSRGEPGRCNVHYFMKALKVKKPN